MPNFTEAEIDSILNSVEETLSKVSALNKSELKKEEPPKPEDAIEQAPSDSAPSAPEAPAQEDAPQAPDMQEPPQEEAPQEQQPEAAPEESLEQESDAPLSDEELQEIYGSMPADELERHFMIIREMLMQHQQPETEMPAPEAKAPEAQAPMAQAPAPAPEMEKSEKIVALETEQVTLKKNLEKAIQLLEVAFKPQRKAVTSLEYIKKGEEQSEAKEYSKEEAVVKLTEITKSQSLSKTEREAITDFTLNGGSKDIVMKIINGGK
jgi:pilus assembly protein FimV